MVRWSLSVLLALTMLAGAMSSSAVAQDDEPEIEYGAISGNAFELFNDDTGTGVEVVAFGPESIDENYGVVFKNFTDEPIYGINAEGDLSGSEGTSTAFVNEAIAAPYAVPTNGLVIQWGFIGEEDEVGDDASFDPDVTYGESPAPDGAPILPLPVDEITTDGDTISAHVTNGYTVEIYSILANLVCFDDDGNVTAGAGAVPIDQEFQIQPIPVGGETTFEFELPSGTSCDYFLAGGVAIDDSDGASSEGTETIANEPQVPSQADQDGTSSSGGTGIDGPVADCTPFADYDQAQEYYAENPDEQPTIDPDADGFACEVFFGVDPTVGDNGGSDTGTLIGSGNSGNSDNGTDTGVSVPDAPVVEAPVVEEPVAPAPPPASACDPAYPSVCIAPPSQVGDLDCPDVAAGNFTVLPPDPHGFDGNDNDGLGCESN